MIYRRRVRRNPAPEAPVLANKLINGFDTVLKGYSKHGCSDKFLQLTGPMSGSTDNVEFYESLLRNVIPSLLQTLSGKIVFHGPEYLAFIYCYEGLLRAKYVKSKGKKKEFLYVAELCAWIRSCRSQVPAGHLDGGGLSEVLLASIQSNGMSFVTTASVSNAMKKGWDKKPLSLVPFLHPLALGTEIQAVRTEIADKLPTWSEQWEILWQKLVKLGIPLPMSIPMLHPGIEYEYLIEGLIGPYGAMTTCKLEDMLYFLAAKDIPLLFWVLSKITRTVLSLIVTKDRRFENVIRAVENWSVHMDDKSLKELMFANSELAPLRPPSLIGKLISTIASFPGGLTSQKIPLPTQVASAIINLGTEAVGYAYGEYKPKQMGLEATLIVGLAADIHADLTGYKWLSKQWMEAKKQMDVRFVGVAAASIPGF